MMSVEVLFLRDILSIIGNWHISSQKLEGRKEMKIRLMVVFFADPEHLATLQPLVFK